MAALLVTQRSRSIPRHAAHPFNSAALKRANHRREFYAKSYQLVVFFILLLFGPMFPPLPEENIPSFESLMRYEGDKSATKSGASRKDPLLDPAHSNRLERISNITSFPVPKFRGCIEGKFCTFSNVCFSHRKGMMIFDRPDNPVDPNNPESEWYAFFHDPRTVRERAPVVVPFEQYSQFTNVYHVPGETLVIDCHCQQALESNTERMLQGHGNLFGAAAGFYKSRTYFGTNSSQPTFDMVLYHHCSLTTNVWPWGKFVDGLIWDAALEAGTVSVEKDNIDDARVFLPINWEKSERVDPDDIVVCGETVRQEPYTLGLYFGNYLGGSNPQKLALKWKKWMAQKLNLTEKEHRLTQSLPFSAAANTSDSTSGSCVRNLRIATWNMTDDSLSHLVNLGEIKQLVSEYTSRPILVLSTNSQTSPEEQVSIFRSFDLLITTHGSHLANQIFSPRKAVIIEVGIVFTDECWQLNGWQFLEKYIMSYGHLPHNNEDLTSRIPMCQEHDFGLDPNSTCPAEIRDQFKSTDIVANLTILRDNLKEAFSVLCDGVM